ncbi:MAG: Gfo/Idh/MocA family oxidoreductase [Candidatus Hydrogenedentes bacterium]|nr:Gfo/Idh/MocA family oxidoreductase [Candidatus Hydrogenedentota bacterium]
MSTETPKRPSSLSRRQFLHTAAAATAAATVSSRAHAQSKPDVLRVGVIGCGGRGNGHMKTLRYIHDNDKSVDIVAVCDTYRPRGMKAAEAQNAKYYMDHRELLADPKIDAVFIATPDHIHGYQAMDAVKAGKDVYCEKPVTHWRQFELTKELAKTVKESGRVFQLGSQGMSDPAWREMRKLVQDGLIGQPIHAECGYFRVGDWGERGMPIDDPNAKPGPDLNWEAFLGDSPKRDFDVSRYFRWRMYEDYAGGPSTDLFPHSLTPTLFILGLTMPSMAVAAGGKWRYQEREVPDTFNMLIDYPEQVTIAVLGTQGNDYQNTNGGRGAGGRIPVVRGWEGTITVDGQEIVFTPADESKKQAQRFPFEGTEDMVAYFKHFLDCCRKRETETWSTMEHAYHVQTALQMGTLALRESKVAKFDKEKETIVL